MVDFAKLIVSVESKGVKQGEKALADFSKGAGAAEDATKKLSLGAKIMLVAAMAAVAKGAYDTARAIDKMTSRMDESAKTASALGMLTEEFTKMQYQASLAGMSSGDLEQSLRYLNRNIVANHKAFRAMGVSTTDATGAFRRAEDVMGDVADRFAEYQDGAGKTALSMELFGRTGERMVPMLNAGADGLRKMGDEADRLGIVFTDKAARGAELFRDNLTRINALKDGMVARITQALLPALLDVTDGFIDIGAEGLLTEEALEKIGNAARYVASTMYGMIKISQIGAQSVKGFADASNRSWEGVGAALSRVMRGDFAGALDAIGEADKEAAAAFGRTGESVKKIFEEWMSGYDKMHDKAAIAERMERRLSDLNKLRAEIPPVVNEQADAEGRINEQLRQRAGAIAEMLNPLEALYRKESEIYELREKGFISAQTADRALLESSRMYDESLKREISSLIDANKSKEDLIQQSYDKQRQVIMSLQAATELEKTELMIAAERERTDALKAIQQELLQQQIDADRARIASYGQMTGGITALSRQFAGEQSGIYRGLFAVSKMFSLADAMVQVGGATAKAANSAPYPYNLANIAQMVGVGAGIVAEIAAVSFAGYKDRGGTIPAGQWGIAGEFGPEIVRGPATVTSRNDTARMSMGQRSVVNNRIVNVVDPAMITDWARTDEGEQTIMNVINRNAERLPSYA